MAAMHEAGLETTGALYRQLPTEAVGLAVAGLVFAFLCHGLVSTVALGIWLGLVAATVAIRLWSASRYRFVSRQTPRKVIWNNCFIAGAAVLGLAFGFLAVLALRQADLQQASVIVLWIAFISICAVPIYNGAMGPVLGFALPAIVLPTLAMFAKATSAAAIVGIIMLIALGLIVLSSRTLYRANSRLMALEDDVQQLRGQLESRRTENDRLNLDARGINERRQHAENEARQATADLALVKSKAHALAETLTRVSPLCPVTGIANRRSLEEHLDAEWRRQMRAKHPLSVLMCEIDEFPHYRETYGAQAADALLHRIARLAGAVGRRPGDLAARYDGAVMAVLLPDCDSRNAVRIGDTLRKRIEQQKIPHEINNIGETVTAHIGVATLIPVKEYQPAELVQRIDKALFEARFQGGNCVVAFRTMDKLKVEHWNPKADDLLSRQAMMHKLIIRGFKSERVGFPPSSVLPDKTSDRETVYALYQGELKFIIEGEFMLLRAGDCLYIPAGTTWGAEVVSPREVLGFEGYRSG